MSQLVSAPVSPARAPMATTAHPQLRAQATAPDVALDEYLHPSMPRVFQSVLRACNSLTSDKEWRRHHTRAERLFDSWRHQKLVSASHSPHTYLRIAIAMDGLYLGGATGAHLGMRAARMVCAGDLSLLRLPFLPVIAVAPLLQGPAFLAAMLTGDAVIAGDAQNSPPRTPTQACQALVKRTSGALQETFAYLLLGAALVGRAATFCLGFVLVAAAGAGGAAGGFLWHVLWMNTVFSPAFASVVQTLNFFCGGSWNALSRLSKWTENNEEVFARMPYGLGHLAEQDRSEYLFFERVQKLKETIRHDLVRLDTNFLDAKVLGTSAQPFAQPEIDELHAHISSQLDRLCAQERSFGQAYRKRCIESYHFDPGSFLQPPADTAHASEDASEELQQLVAFRHDPIHWHDSLKAMNDEQWYRRAYGWVNTQPRELGDAHGVEPSASSTPLYTARANALLLPMQQASWLQSLIPLPLFSTKKRQRLLAESRQSQAARFINEVGSCCRLLAELQENHHTDAHYVPRATELLQGLYRAAADFRYDGPDQSHFYDFVYDFFST